MVTVADYGQYETAWCPGCGNFAILKAVKKALAQERSNDTARSKSAERPSAEPPVIDSGIAPHEVLFVSGIGQAAKAPQYLNCNLFDGLHGRALPVATGAKLANPGLRVISESGDGCTYGEGGNHFLAALRRNIGVTLLVHDNQVYGLTKGQASPTSDEGFVTKAQPAGALSAPFNPVAIAVAMRASFVARGFAGSIDHLAELVRKAMARVHLHKGLALVDILQPCVAFNKVNTFAWYKKRCYEIPAGHDPRDREAAMKLAEEWGERIPIGVIYEDDRPGFETRVGALSAGPLVGRKVDAGALALAMEKYA